MPLYCTKSAKTQGVDGHVHAGPRGARRRQRGAFLEKENDLARIFIFRRTGVIGRHINIDPVGPERLTAFELTCVLRDG